MQGMAVADPIRQRHMLFSNGAPIGVNNDVTGRKVFKKRIGAGETAGVRPVGQRQLQQWRVLTGKVDGDVGCRRDQAVPVPGTAPARRRRPADQFPSAGIHAADAGICFFRLSADYGGLSACRCRTLPLFQLWGCHVSDSAVLKYG